MSRIFILTQKYLVYSIAAIVLLSGFACQKTTGDKPASCAGNGAGAISSPVPTDGRFAAAAIALPNDGYTDSIFINSTGDRIYFTHSYLTATDFLGVTTGMPHGVQLSGHTVGAGLDYNSDLYYIEWSGTAWSSPINLGSAVDSTKVNSLGHECCMWLNDSETQIIFYRDTFDIGALGARGNYVATRANRNAAWGTPTLMPGKYGSASQSTTLYRHDIQLTASGDLYLWEKDSSANTSTLLYGKKNGSSWDAPVVVPGMESLGTQSNTQPWVSRDELTLLFNTRTANGDTKLNKMTRSNICSSWGTLTTVSTAGFSDPSGLAVWGEPTFNQAENFMLFIRFDTSTAGWPVQIMYSPGQSSTSFAAPTKLN